MDHVDMADHEAECQLAFQRGQSIGLVTGRDEGFSQGQALRNREIDAAHELELKDRFQRGVQQGIQDGLIQGMQQGYQEGLRVGLRQGLQQCLTESYENFQAGRREGRDQGLLTGRDEGLAEGLKLGREDGINAGFIKGRDQGVLEGFAKGQAQGILEGAQKSNELVYAALRKGERYLRVYTETDIGMQGSLLHRETRFVMNRERKVVGRLSHGVLLPLTPDEITVARVFGFNLAA